jgi:LDH2 family malate/lactate/ureidoglycolate dehydrogenase
MTAELRIPHPDLVEAIELALRLAGVPEEVRRVEAEIMAEADLMGVPSHGVRMLPNLVRGLREGRASAAPQLQKLRNQGAVCVLDCDNGPGRYCASAAMQCAMDKALEFGVGVCLAVRTTHWGRAFSYAIRAARAGMIGLCTTNAIPNMVAWGSDKPLLGNNPLAIGAPRGEGQEPIVLDIAMSQAAIGKVGTYLREGKEVPTGWGLDSSGNPTNDPAAIMSSQRFLPMGEHKGVGLALMMEILTGALGGLYLSHEVARIDSTALDPNATKFFLALNIDAFSSRSDFAAKIQELAAYLTSASAPDQVILFPGENSARTRDRYLREGIPLHPAIVKDLRSIGMFAGGIPKR